MGDVVDIEANLPHCVKEVICVKCMGRWISVAPVSLCLKDFECKCGYVGGVISTGCEAIMEKK